MATHLKRRIARETTDEMDRKVRATVEAILADVKKRGDAAVREYSTPRNAPCSWASLSPNIAPLPDESACIGGPT